MNHIVKGILGEAAGSRHSVLDELHRMFVEEWMEGHADYSGTHHAPVSREEAERLWQTTLPELERAMTEDPDVQDRLDLPRSDAPGAGQSHPTAD